MTEKVFADTNIVIYAESRHAKKSPAAVAILEASPVISTQVVNETVSVLTRKHGFALADANQVALSLLDLCEVVPVDVQTVREARNARTSHVDPLRNSSKHQTAGRPQRQLELARPVRPR